MTIDRDPTLQDLFDAARQELAGKAFVDNLMERINARRRRAMLGWACVSFVLIVGILLLASPILNAVSFLTQVLPESLIEVEDEFVAQLLSPVNSVAAPVAVCILGLVWFYKKIFAR